MTEQETKDLEEEVNTEAQEDITEQEETEETIVKDPEQLATELADLNQRFLRVAADFEN